MTESSQERVENAGRNCLLRAISPFSTVFSKHLYCRHIKTRARLGKGQPNEKVLALSKLEAFAYDHFNVAKMVHFSIIG